MLWHGGLEKAHEEIRSSGPRKVQEHAEARAESSAVQCGRYAFRHGALATTSSWALCRAVHVANVQRSHQRSYTDDTMEVQSMATGHEKEKARTAKPKAKAMRPRSESSYNVPHWRQEEQGEQIEITMDSGSAVSTCLKTSARSSALRASGSSTSPRTAVQRRQEQLSARRLYQRHQKLHQRRQHHQHQCKEQH